MSLIERNVMSSFVDAGSRHVNVFICFESQLNSYNMIIQSYYKLEVT